MVYALHGLVLVNAALGAPARTDLPADDAYPVPAEAARLSADDGPAARFASPLKRS